MADNFQVRDATGTALVVRATDDGGVYTPHHNANIVDADIQVPVDQQAIYRYLAYSTSTPLTGGTTYTGASIDGIDLRRVTGRVYADQAGALHFEHSDDGSTWDRLTAESITVNAGDKTGFDVTFKARYLRVVYVNGGVAQAAFRLSVYPCAA